MASDDLRARIAEVMRGHYPIAACIDGTVTCRCGATVQADRERLAIREHRADAVVAVVQEELDREAELSQTLMEQRQQMAAERYVWQERGDRYRLAWLSARRRAADRRRAGERLPGGAIRQALIDAGIITAEDRVADAVEKIRALGPRPACKHGVLPTQGLCLYCAAERNLPTTKEPER